MGRQENLSKLKGGDLFDLIVIGGGATGCGTALDAASRGLQVALIEKNDFSEGTSSRSTKLAHGGVRYLKMAVTKLDRGQYNLVRDGLRERYFLLQNAPHLSRRLPLVTPLYRWIDVPYIFAGLKLYDCLSGTRNIGRSRLLKRNEALRRFPMLKANGLKAGVLYFDGQFHDARMAVLLALTAEQHGAVIVNHVAVSGFLKAEGKISGVQLTDSLSGETWPLRARGVINAAGPFVDQVRRMDNPGAPEVLSPSTGIHLVLDKRFAPPDTGLMIPETEDGRVLFVLPWQGHALVGTTDKPAKVSEHPQPLETEIEYLVRHVSRYFNLQVARSDVKAAWAGLRPLVSDYRSTDTAGLARDYVIAQSESGLLTIAGGKWTTYRKMAQDSVDQAIRVFTLSAPKPDCQTENLPIIGGSGYSENGYLELIKEYAFAEDVAQHLHQTYGDQAVKVAELAAQGYGARLLANHPMLEAEVVYAARHEMAERVIDVLARRTSIALLDTEAARTAVPRVREIMANELGWSQERCQDETGLAELRLSEAI